MSEKEFMPDNLFDEPIFMRPKDIAHEIIETAKSNASKHSLEILLRNQGRLQMNGRHINSIDVDKVECVRCVVCESILPLSLAYEYSRGDMCCSSDCAMELRAQYSKNS